MNGLSWRVIRAQRPLNRAAALLFLLSALCGFAACQGKVNPPASEKTKISFVYGGITSLLPDIAREKGYFAEEGLEAAIVVKGDGKSAMTAFLNDEATFGLTGEPPLVKAVYDRDDFVILATLMTSDNATRILTLDKNGIRRAEDFRGKRIATVKGTAPHFFLDLYLGKNRIPPAEVEIVFLETKKLVPELLEGKIDAFAITDRFFIEGKKVLGKDAYVLSEPGLCLSAVYMVAKKKYVEQNPEAVRGALKALLKSEDFVAASPAEAVAFTARLREIPEEDARELLADQRHAVTFTHPALLALEDTARWVLEKGMAAGTAEPDFMARTWLAPLSSLKPDAVKLMK